MLFYYCVTSINMKCNIETAGLSQNGCFSKKIIYFWLSSLSFYTKVIFDTQIIKKIIMNLEFYQIKSISSNSMFWVHHSTRFSFDRRPHMYQHIQMAPKTSFSMRYVKRKNGFYLKRIYVSKTQPNKQIHTHRMGRDIVVKSYNRISFHLFSNQNYSYSYKHLFD